jgi:hypothetical protein
MLLDTPSSAAGGRQRAVLIATWVCGAECYIDTLAMQQVNPTSIATQLLNTFYTCPWCGRHPLDQSFGVCRPLQFTLAPG